MKNTQIKAVVLAAGKGTRMKSVRAKVLHELFFAPMLHHVIRAIAPLNLLEIVVVTGHQAEVVEKSLADFEVSFARQERQRGTADAVSAAEAGLADFRGTILILCGDTPLVRTETLRAMLEAHRAAEAVLTVMTTRMDDPANYGRIVTDQQGDLLRIVEEKDASVAEKGINEVNAGIYCVDSAFLFGGLRGIGSNNRQGEFYLTDLVEIARAEGLAVNRHVCEESLEVLGINSRVELAEAHAILQKRRNHQLMTAGVTIIGPDSVDIALEVEIGADCEVGRNVLISGRTVIGRGCRIGPNTVIRDCRIGDGAVIGALCCLENREVGMAAVLEDATIISGEG
ncbi:MAG: NTP transferase domain-containing protein [Desulfurivibrionaceae bacterium]|nr:NTP transferase domain-containing protein [Desulfobulbales bacterium]MDT8334576.1 NTP transferase domain-containing protein [Desulfurivibrionaceae bacterium]